MSGESTRGALLHDGGARYYPSRGFVLAMRLALEIGLIRPVADRRQLTFFARTKKVSKEMRRNPLPR